jgi:hypothetical protein
MAECKRPDRILGDVGIDGDLPVLNVADQLGPLRE